ncbi:(Fe-S)-binding protein [Thiohalorhabdus sp.]|uniref:(Fe-S)-binding protein n=1 Tax=Thiohalorhabdus sp. TaxID=3094134 RepID=UPI002FC2D002
MSQSSAAHDTRPHRPDLGEARYDKQGELSDAERVDRAVSNFVKDIGAVTATHLDACIHCGQCAEACHFYRETGDPKYTPVHKLAPFRRAYQREMSPFGFIRRWLGLTHKVTVDELQRWQELLYDSCTVCGRCTMVCPMGIDIAGLVSQARHGMFKAGLVPAELHEVAEKAEREGSPLGANPEVFEDRIEWLADDYEVAIPLDKESADVLVTVSSIEIMKYPRSIADMARILNHMGVDWTFRTDGYEATNFGLLSGNTDWQADMSGKIIEAAKSVGAHTVVLPECGHAYTALRWMGANSYGAELPFKVRHISEYLADGVRQGSLKLKSMDRSVTFHDPCQVSRRGGATAEPRVVLDALGVELREMDETGDLNWCCGGGGGVVTISRADAIRHKVFRIKQRQVEDTGAEAFVTSCSNCRMTFDDDTEHFNWGRKVESLVELVADHLEA